MSLFSDIFDDFDHIFAKAWNKFDRPVVDQNPFRVIAKENGYLVVCNTLGLKKEDVKVNIERRKGLAYPILKIQGETNLESINFTNSVNLGIGLKMEEKEIESVQYEVHDGLTIIFIKSKKNQPEATLTAECVEDGSLDF